MHLQETKQKAIDLRKRGYSYSYIAQFVPVSKSTLSDWLGKISFVPNEHTIETVGKARAASGAKKIEQIRIRLYLYPDNNELECVNYWSNFTKVPISQFHTSIIDRRENKKENKKGKLPFGTAHMSIISLGDKNFGVNLHRLILAWIDKVLC